MEEVTEARLRLFLMTDDRARWRAFLLSALIGTAAGTISIWSRDSDSTVALITIVAASVCFGIKIWMYCRASARGEARIDSGAMIGRRFVLSVITAALFIVMLVVPSDRLEAEIVDRRLRDLTRKPVLSSDDLAGIARNLDIVHKNHISIPPKTFRRVRDAVKNMALNQPSTSDLPEAINAVAKFEDGDPRNFLPPPGAPPNEAQAAFIEGAKEYHLAYRYRDTVFDPELKTAVLAYTKAITLTPNSPLHREALLGRASAYLGLRRFEDALVDSKTADDLGSTDLSGILDIETSALLQRGGNDDLKLTIKLATLGLAIRPPSYWGRFSGAVENQYISDMVGKRAEAYYRSGEFSAAVEDCKASLAIRPRNYLYRTMILALLRLGDAASAGQTAVEWVDTIPGPASRDALRIVEENKSNPQRAIELLEAARRAIEKPGAATP